MRLWATVASVRPRLLTESIWGCHPHRVSSESILGLIMLHAEDTICDLRRMIADDLRNADMCA